MRPNGLTPVREVRRVHDLARWERSKLEKLWPVWVVWLLLVLLAQYFLTIPPVPHLYSWPWQGKLDADYIRYETHARWPASPASLHRAHTVPVCLPACSCG